MPEEKPKVKKSGRFFSIFIRTVLVLLILSCCAFGFMAGKAYSWISDVRYLLDGNALQVNSLTSYVYDKNNKKIDKLSGKEDRDWVDIDLMPDYVKNSFISIEDERFYSHNGIDVYRILGALWADLKTGKRNQGGSTITQQYIKNTMLNDSKTLKRKVQEQYLALQLEKKFSKPQILQAYLNTINLGHGAYGIGAAARIYFGKDVQHLTIAEAATIAANPQAPNYYDPYINYKANHERQRIVLKKMYELKYITPTQYYKALKEDVRHTLLHHKKIEFKTIHSYFVEASIDEAKRELKEKGYNPNLVYNGGLKIYTTFDKDIQNKLDKDFNKPGLFPTFAKDKYGVVQPQSAMVILDYHTGEVKALIGGRGKKTANLTFNRAVDSLRQPGSSIKPLAVYGPAIDAAGYNEYSTVVDEPYSIGNYTPHDDYAGYAGAMTFKHALEISANIPALKVLESVGHNISYKYLTEKFRINSITNDDKISAPSLALGGLTHGVTVYDMTAAYGAIANKGIYVEPHMVTKIVDTDDNVLVDNTRPFAEKILNPDTAIQLTDMMQGVILEGTGKKDASFKKIQMPEAGKTGTTTATKDKWFVGYTPYYVAAVWLGYDNPQAMNISTNYSAVAWRTVMEDIHKDLPNINFFDTPSGVTPVKPVVKKAPKPEKQYIKIDICTDSGLKATPLCPQDKVKTEVFEVGKEPQEYCNIHGTSTSSDTNSYNSIDQNSYNNYNSSDSSGSYSNNDSAGYSENKSQAQQNNTAVDNKQTQSQNSSDSTNTVNQSEGTATQQTTKPASKTTSGSSSSNNLDTQPAQKKSQSTKSSTPAKKTPSTGSSEATNQ